MSKQLRFMVVTEDHAQLLQFAEQKGFRAVPVAIESDTIAIPERPTEVKAPTNVDFFYLLPHEFSAAEAFYNELPADPHLSKLIPWSSPVIEVSPAVATDKPMEGRIYICTDPSDPRYDKAMKAYDILARFLKKWPKSRDGRFHIGPRVAPMMRDSEEHTA